MTSKFTFVLIFVSFCIICITNNFIIYMYKVVILIYKDYTRSLVSTLSLIFVLWEFTFNSLLSSFSFH